MGATRLPNTPDHVYAARHARYMRNRERILARQKAQYAQDKPIRQAAAQHLRGIAREARLAEKRRAAYAERHQPLPPTRGTTVADYLHTYKTDRPCLDCGHTYPPVVMEFDHVRGTKTRNVSRCNSITALLHEIAKCDLVCANCHRLRTFARRSDYTR